MHVLVVDVEAMGCRGRCLGVGGALGGAADDGDARAVHGDGRALGVQFNSRRRLRHVLHDSHVRLELALRYPDRTPDELPLPIHLPGK